MIQYSNRCSLCQQSDESPLLLDCSHSICLECLSHLVMQQQQQQILRDELEIECGYCTYVTNLSLALVYKLLRPLQKRNKYLELTNAKTLFCMDCLDQCFGLQEYLKGNHAGHEVESIDKAFPVIRNMLIYASKSLQQGIHHHQKENQKMIHCKGLLNDVMNANIIKIKMNFQTLRQQIIKRQHQILDNYTYSTVENLKAIDQKMQQIDECILNCQQHLKWIIERVIDAPQSFKSTIETIQIINYFAKNQQIITREGSIQYGDNLSVPFYMQMIKNNKNKVNLQQVKNIIEGIRSLEIINHVSNDLKISQSNLKLSREYFDYKRKQVLNNNIFDELSDKSCDEQPILTVKLKQINNILRVDKNLKTIGFQKYNRFCV